jgi:hypothetical protein
LKKNSIQLFSFAHAKRDLVVNKRNEGKFEGLEGRVKGFLVLESKLGFSGIEPSTFGVAVICINHCTIWAQSRRMEATYFILYFEKLQDL